jgi:hypothetical protein
MIYVFVNALLLLVYIFMYLSDVPRGLRGGVQPPPPKFRRPSKIVPNSTRLWKLLKIAEFRTPTPPRCSKKCSKILKLPPVRNCITLAMTNKLVVIINSLKATKIKKMLLYEMKFLVPNYSCLQNPWLGGYRPQIPVLSIRCPQLNLLNSSLTKFQGTPLMYLPCWWPYRGRNM